MIRLQAVVVVVVAVACACACGPGKVAELEEFSAENRCFDDPDCCVVVEACSADIFVVTADEFERARTAAEFDEGGVCNRCATPASTVSCVDGRCLAVAFEDPAVQVAEGTPASSCGVRELALEEGRDPGPATSFETRFVCGGF